MLKIRRKQRERSGKEKLSKELQALSYSAPSSKTKDQPNSGQHSIAENLRETDSPALHNMLIKLRNLAARIDQSANDPKKLKCQYLNLLDEMAKQSNCQPAANKLSTDPVAKTKNNKLTLYVFEDGFPARQRDIEVTHHLKKTVQNLRVQAQNVMSASSQMLPSDFSREAAALTDQWLHTSSGSTLTPNDCQADRRLALSLLR